MRPSRTRRESADEESFPKMLAMSVHKVVQAFVRLDSGLISSSEVENRWKNIGCVQELISHNSLFLNTGSTHDQWHLNATLSSCELEIRKRSIARLGPCFANGNKRTFCGQGSPSYYRRSY